MPTPDFGLTATDYATHRQGFPPSFVARLQALGAALPGQRALDLGTGTGLLARQLAAAGCIVTGLDPSAALLEKARAAALADGLAIPFVQARAEDSGLPAASFDLVTAATAWHWFDAPRAAAEARRLLAPGGRLVIAALEWQADPGSILAQTSALLAAFSPRPAGGRQSTLRLPEWGDDLTRAGFSSWEAFAYVEPIAYSHAGWVGRVRASQGAGASMPPATLAEFSAALTSLLKRLHPAEPMALPHRISALVAQA